MPNSLEQAQADLREYEHEFYAIVEEAIQEYVDCYRDLRVNHSLRTEASIIHDLMVKVARERLEGRPGFFLSLENNLFLVAYGRRYAIKLKKLDENFQTRNISTQLVLDYLQHGQMCLPTMPQPTNLHLGYQRVDNSPELLACPILLVCPDGEEEEVLWTWELDSGEASTIPIHLPDTPTPAAPAQQRVRVRISPDEEEESENQAEERGA